MSQERGRTRANKVGQANLRQREPGQAVGKETGKMVVQEKTDQLADNIVKVWWKLLRKKVVNQERVSQQLKDLDRWEEDLKKRWCKNK